MASSEVLSPCGATVPTCSKKRASSGLRSGRAPGRPRSSSRGSMLACNDACRGTDEPRGRALTRELGVEDGMHAFSRQSSEDSATREQSWSSACSSERPPVASFLSGDVLMKGLLEDAVEDYADGAMRLVQELDDEAMPIEVASLPDSDCSYCSDRSDCSDYPDSELDLPAAAGADLSAGEAFCSTESASAALRDAVDAKRPAFHPGNAFFLNYVFDMFDAALGGDVQDFFAPPNEEPPETPSSVDCHTHEACLPTAAALAPCSRPVFRRRLRPRELPPPADELHMDCLPSTPACLSAPAGPGVSFWAAEMQRAARAEDSERVVDGANNFEGMEGFAACNSSPADSRTASCSGECSQAPVDVPQAAKPAAPRPPSVPRFRRAGTAAAVCVSGMTTAPSPPTGPPPASSCAAPRPPSNPPSSRSAPSCRRPRSPRWDASYETADISLHGGQKQTVPRHITAPRPPLDRLGPKAEALAPKSAMEMDLGVVASSAVPRADAAPATFSRFEKGRSNVAAGKSSDFLPPILQQKRAGVESPRTTWKVHDVL